MNRKKLFLLLLMVATIALSGCSLIVKDEKVDQAQVIIDVNGEKLSKANVNTALDISLNQMQQQYAQYGLNIDPTDPEVRNNQLDTVLDQLAREMVVKQKITEMGLDKYSEEEEAAFKADAQKEYDESLETIKMLMGNKDENGNEVDDETVLKNAQNYLLMMGMTPESLAETTKINKQTEAFKKELIKDVTVSDEEVEKFFNESVDQQKAQFDADINAFGGNYNQGAEVLYAPKGYRYVKQIFTKISDENASAITALQTELQSAQTVLTSAQKSVTDNTEALADEGIKEDFKKELEEQAPVLKTALEDAQKKVDELTKKLEDLNTTAFEEAKTRADAVKAKLEGGADFAAVIESDNQDPGMNQEPIKTTGYAVAEGLNTFDPAFVSAAMALQNVGDVSDVVKGQQGFYIIRYEGDVQEGVVNIDTVKEKLQGVLLTQKQEEAFNTAVDGFVKDANVKTYKNRMEN